MRPTAKKRFTDLAYEYTKEHGAKSIRELLDALRINPNTKRTSACLPTVKSASQFLRMDKRFKAISEQAVGIHGKSYLVSRYQPVEEGGE